MAAASTPPSGSSAPTVLILGGTGEARALAAELVAAGADRRVISSLAGRVARPRLPVGEVRIGGFGGPEKLADWLRAERVACVVDATHPFAERISASAARAAELAGVPVLRLQRPGWIERPGDDWHRVADLEEAAALLPRFAGRGATTTAADPEAAAAATALEPIAPAAGAGAPPPPVRVLLTTGRQGLAAFRETPDAWFLIRCVDPPDPADLPPRHELLLDRGPYTVPGELTLIDTNGIDVVATKDSGGPLTVAKLDAARQRGLPVIVVDRPAGPDVPTVQDVAEATTWATTHLTER